MVNISCLTPFIAKCSWPMNSETKQRIRELPGLIARASSDNVLNFRCPNCGGNLVIHLTGGERSALGISCERYCFATNLDGISDEPRWMKTLGEHVLTGKK
jgi:hypothetical protein